MLRAVEAALPGVGLAADQKVFPLGVERSSGSQQLGEMAPVDEQIMDRSVLAEGGGVADERLEKEGKAASDISPEAILNSRWRTLPRPIACPLMRTLKGGSVTSIWASSPPSNTSNEVLCEVSPQTKRCRPSSQRSPSWLTAGPSKLNLVRSSADHRLPASPCRATPGRPRRSRNRSARHRNQPRSVPRSASASRSESQIASSGSRLSATTVARFSAALRPAIVKVGTAVNPRRLAASRRA